MTSAFVYTAVFILTMTSGEVMEADEASYKTYDACMTQAEADAKGMAREWEWEAERTGLPQFFKNVSVRCEKRRLAGSKGHVGR